MNVVILFLNIFFTVAPYVVAAAAGAYVDHRFSSKLAARVAALEAKAVADVKVVQADVTKVEKAV